jgi:POT family proton-dependent oligopeptide transporter
VADPVAIRPWQFPRGALLIIGFEFCERVGFYSMISLLALFLSAPAAQGGFGWSVAASLIALGVFSGLMYGLPVIGGWVADRQLGHRRAIVLGGALMLSGYTALTVTAAAAKGQSSPVLTLLFWLSIGLLIVGNSLMKSTLVVALGDTFSGQDARREGAYAYYYAGINLGGLVAGFLAGSVATIWGWAPAFGVSAVSLALALSAFLILGRALPLRVVPSSTLAPAQTSMLTFAQTRNRLGILAVFAALLLVYSTGSFQLYGTMSFFLERKVDRHLGSFDIPTQWFTSVEAAALIVAAPTLAAVWASLRRQAREPDIVIKYAVALGLGAAGLLLFAVAAGRLGVGSHAAWPLPAAGIVIQAGGEVAAWTVSYGLVYRLAPPRIVAAVMGAFYACTLGLGGYLAGWVGTLAQRWGDARFFLVLGGVTALTGLGAVALRPLLRRAAVANDISLVS